MSARGESTLARGGRRSITVLFADISNFTGLGARLDPEELTELVRSCFSELVEEIEARGGWLEKQIGDALVAVFGAPVAHEDDPVRAVQAAVAILARVKAMNVRIRDRIGAPLDVHVGINTGLAVVAPALERDGSDDFMALGDAVTIAARLQQAAKPGQILVGRATYRATDWCYEYRSLAPLKLKGKQERVTAWECLGPRSNGGRALVRVTRSPLVGRSSERDAFLHCFDLLAGGSGGLVLLTGEPGVGKTRLLANAREQAEERGLLWLEGATVSFGEAAAYAPFTKVLRDLVGIEAQDDAATAWRKLDRQAAALYRPDEAAEALPYLGALLALELPEELATSVRYLDGEGVGLQLFRTIRRLFERLARKRPLVLIFEDWHWADDSSAAMLEHLLPLCASVPILLCCSTRSERSPVPALRDRARELNLDDRLVDIELKPLASTEAQELISNLVESSAVPAVIQDQILEKTEGNPFFIEEVVRSLLDRDARIEQIDLPDTLRGAIIARIDRLATEPREILMTAAVLGRNFSYVLLKQLAESPDVDGGLAVLVEAELVRELPDGDRREFAFKHAVTHEVVYDSALLANRRELHLRVARLLESTYADRLDELAGTVAFHYAQAQEWEHAQAFLFRAGDHAGAVAASAEALGYYAKAVEAYSRAFGLDWRDRQRAELDRKIGEAFFRRGEHDRAAEYLEHALGCLGFGYPKTSARLRFMITCAAVRQAVHRLLPLRAYRRISNEGDPWMDELSRVLDTLGWIYFFSNPERVVLDSFRQLNTAERRGFRLAMVRASTGLGFVFDAIPVPRLAGNYHRRAVELGARLDNRRSVGIAYLGLAHHQRYQLAALDDALQNYTRAAEECRSAGDLRARMGATLMLAEVTALTGELGTSLEHGRFLLEIGEEAGDNQVRGWGHHAVGRTLRLSGALELARGHLERGCELSDRVPDYQAFVIASGNLGLCLIEMGEIEDATKVLDRAQQVAHERGLRTFACTDMMKGVTTMCLTLAEHADGAARDKLMRDTSKACRNLARQGRLDRAAAPATLRLHGRYCWLRGDRGKAGKFWRRSMAGAETLGLPYELALTQVEVGTRTSEVGLEIHGRTLLGQLARTASDPQLEFTGSRRP